MKQFVFLGMLGFVADRFEVECFIFFANGLERLELFQDNLYKC